MALERGELRAARLVGPGREVRLLVPGEQADGAVEVAQLLHPGQERGEGEAHARVPNTYVNFAISSESSAAYSRFRFSPK